MKICARLTFTKEANREFLVQAFFSRSEFSKDNTLQIDDDKTAYITIEFENVPPQGIIKAMSHCKIESLLTIEDYNPEDGALDIWYDTTEETEGKENFVDELPGAEAEVPKDDVAVTKVEDAEADATEEDAAAKVEDAEADATEEDAKTKVEDAEADAPEEDAKTTRKDAKSKKEGKDKKPVKKRRYGATIPSEADYLQIPELDQFAEQASSFYEFVVNVSKWLDLSEDDTKYFTELTKQLVPLDKKGYEILQKDVLDANTIMGYGSSRTYKFGKMISEALESKGVFSYFQVFLCTVMKYIDMEERTASNPKVCDEDKSDEEVDAFTSDNKSPPEDVTVEEKKPDYMACKNFVEIYNGIDKDAPMKEKVEELLSKMGLEKRSKRLYNYACQIVLSAISMKTLESIDDIMQNAGINTQSKDGMQMKIKLLEWINEYNKNNHIPRMKIIAFVREIKEVFTLE